MNVEHDGGGFIIFPNSRPEEETGAAPSGDREWLDHCRSREFAERAAAKHATNSRAREVHQELAQAYARLTNGATAK
jgi:hypothetical protein